MAVRRVLKMGEPLLRELAAPVTRFDAQLAALVADMDDTMRHLNGAGIAAPQIGVSARVVIFELKDNPRYPDLAPVPYTVLVNPLVTPLGAEQDLPYDCERRIAVEIKSFFGASDIQELVVALGLFSIHRDILSEVERDCVLYMAMAQRVHEGIFSELLGQLVLRRQQLRLLVFRETEARIVTWEPTWRP